MAKKRYYVVKVGLKPGIYESWDECSKQVKGYPGADFKGFATRKEAERYFNDEDNKCDFTDAADGHIVAFVDGSYDVTTKVYGYGCVILCPGEEPLKFSGAGNNEKSAELRNVTGEMLGAMCAVRYAINNGYKSILICYDYLGIEMWVTGKWQAKQLLTFQYAEAMKKWEKDITICFEKVAAHTNIKYNEMADGLAKEAVKNFAK